jgi:hypothetical protein
LLQIRLLSDQAPWRGNTEGNTNAGAGGHARTYE